MSDFRYPLAILSAVVLALVGWGLGDFHAMIHFFGIDTQQSDNYDFVSGVGPMVTTVVMGGGIFGAVWLHLNCHVTGCPRVGRYPVAGGQFKVCRLHHPDAVVTGRGLTAHHIRAMHLEHHRRAAGP